MALGDDSSGRAVYWIGPPPPAVLTWITRLLELATFLLTAIWVVYYLGGVGLHPKQMMLGANDTGRIFNWHPVLIALAFPVFMAEAVLAYRVPLVTSLDRPQRKIVHAALHSASLLCIVLALIAAFQSHNLKRPTPTPNLYSPHSYLGLAVTILAFLQFFLGFGAYLYPTVAKRHREALGPLHTYLGKATFVAGLANMAVGIQEKTAFVVQGKGLSGAALYKPVVSIPATIELLLLLTGIAVLFHHQPPAAARRHTVDTDNLLADVIDDPAA
ncbi:hypothetical protein WJX81_002123 [Elliptochloris bilobata]|uniref:Cytochrome b561 domain-containing protein n=1 Tax=Elliptochloris bilobata TaxID=381761 RepID=A0AAW1R125_9CHLO